MAATITPALRSQARRDRRRTQPSRHDEVSAALMGMSRRQFANISAGGMTNTGQSFKEQGNEALIVAVASHRDEAAFATLFMYFAPRVKSWLMRQGCDTALAEDLAQETMLVVWRKAGLFNASRASAATWIFTIARNLRIDAVRRERHPSALMPEANEIAETAPRSDELLSTAQEHERVRAAIATLPAGQADVVVAAFYEDTAHAQITQSLNVPLGTVKSRLRLALGRLRMGLRDLK